MISVCEQVRIVNKRGLHARASAKFVSHVNGLDEALTVRVSKDGMDAEGRSILSLMMLGAAKGDTIDICVSGDGAEEALAGLAKLVRDGFDEE
ncbi:HPr kinase [Novosphingobium marinum]|uniref:Phosphocarrier protein n=1 Tax=Novosphingobium marinum TaxID=1514948 RepID=A0A7Z0BSS4_9SPHN|nr:HPr family phosphocarrier protein [Novosphingobium marinum]NYH94429.1 phosphocarrier protein [Novosphingobium marinum]GGC22261.1 HPr kinase [Novosphingobium marinum]